MLYLSRQMIVHVSTYFFHLLFVVRPRSYENEFENKEWIEFINEHNLDWINGSDGGDFRSNFRTLYDVFSTPQTYLLDEEKKIISKKMSIESLEKILEHLYKEEENKNLKKEAQKHIMYEE